LVTEPSEPALVDRATVPPLATRLFPTASLSWTVIAEVLEPFAVIVPEPAEIVDVAVDADPAVTENVEVPEVRPLLEAVIVTEPAVCPVTVSEATPDDAVAVPSPVTEPAPALCAKVTTVELSDVTTLLFASSTAAVSVFVAPEAALELLEVKTSFVAAPVVTENVELSEVRPLLEAVIVTEPAVCPVTVSEATPDDAVAVPSPVTEPAPALCAKVTTVELSDVTTLLFASSTAAVSVFVAPDATLTVFEVNTNFVAALGTNVTDASSVIAALFKMPVTVAVPAVVDDVRIAV